MILPQDEVTFALYDEIGERIFMCVIRDSSSTILILLLLFHSKEFGHGY